MREIKFRVWHAGQMLTQPINTPFAVSRLFGFLDAVGVHAFDNVMQFTGLKDKNGKEIFEGDLVKVFGAESGEMIVHVDDITNPPLSTLYPAGEIIGNIHENPQLVEGK